MPQAALQFSQYSTTRTHRQRLWVVHMPGNALSCTAPNSSNAESRHVVTTFAPSQTLAHSEKHRCREVVHIDTSKRASKKSHQHRPGLRYSEHTQSAWHGRAHRLAVSAASFVACVKSTINDATRSRQQQPESCSTTHLRAAKEEHGSRANQLRSAQILTG
jgi:hypothetical protein